MAGKPILKNKFETGTRIGDRLVELAADQLAPQPDITENEVYLLYAAFCGDVERTAHAANTTPAEVIKLRDAGGWDTKLRGILELKKSGRPGDVERAINRAINFIQAHRLRMLLENILRELHKKSSEEIFSMMSTAFDRDGNPVEKLSTRAFADLAAAIEKCHAMTYLATNDSAAERKGRNDDFVEGAAMGDIHAKIAAHMSKPTPPA